MLRNAVFAFCFACLFLCHAPAAAAGQANVSQEKRNLTKAIATQSDSATIAAIKSLIRAGEPGAEVLLSMAPRLAGKAERSYWLVLDGLSAFKDPMAYTKIGEAILKYRKSALGGDLLLAMQSCRSRFVIRVVRRVLSGCPYDMQVSSLDIAGRIPVRRTVDVLLDALERECESGKTDLKHHIINVLVSLTSQNYGEAVVNWRGWWKRNRAKGLQEIQLEAESRSTRTVVDFLDPVREKGYRGLEKRPKDWLIVITASPKERAFDQIERVLAQMEIPHKVVTKEAFSEAKFSMKGVRVIAINCMLWREYCRNPNHRAGGQSNSPRLEKCVGPGPHMNKGYEFSKEAIQKLKAFVERGGYLFTEDMVLEELLSKAWPKFVSVGKFIKEKTVPVRPGPGLGGHPYLKGVFVSSNRAVWDPFEEEENPADAYDIPESEEDDESEGGGRTRVVGQGEAKEDADIDIEPIQRHWKIDDESPGIKIHSRRVTVLMGSAKVKEGGSSAVALTFQPRGKSGGAVLHVLSHFGKQRAEEDEFALQNLLLNFMLEAHRRYPAAKP